MILPRPQRIVSVVQQLLRDESGHRLELKKIPRVNFEVFCSTFTGGVAIHHARIPKIRFNVRAGGLTSQSTLHRQERYGTVLLVHGSKHVCNVNS